MDAYTCEPQIMTAEEDKPTGPQTPLRASKAKTPDATPTSAPAAGAARRRSATNRAQPTLLGDFLLGRQTPARVAADREKWRQKQMTLEQVKKEMRESAVRKVQAPGGVHDRVKQWQKKNAAAMTNDDPLAAPSEPSEIHIQVDEKSVTEEDRVRIKKGIKPKPSPKVIVVERKPGDVDKEKKEKEKEKPQEKETPQVTEEESNTDSKTEILPKKRVVSDTNWMKNKTRSPQRSQSPKVEKPSNSNTGSPIPKSFSPRTAPNPTVKSKIKDWAARVEVPDEPQVKRYSVARSVGSSDGIRVSTSRDDRSARYSGKSRAQSEDCEIIVETHKPRRPRTAGNDGIRVTPARKRSDNDDGIRVTPSTSTQPDDGIRVTPSTPKLPDDGIRVYSGEPKAAESSSTLRPSSGKGSARASSAHREAKPSETEPSEMIEVIEEPESDEPDTPTRRGSRRKTSRLSSKLSSKLTQQTEDKSHADTGTTMTEDVSDGESWSSESRDMDVDSDIPSSIPSKLADIPVGYSAFSELNLPTKPKAKRNPSFKGATNVLKKAFVESKKILSERADPPPKPVANQPRSIESWLNKTVDPFVEDSKATAATTPESKRKSVEKDWTGERRARRSTSGSKQTPTEEPVSELTTTENEESIITLDEEPRKSVDTQRTHKPNRSEKTEKSEKYGQSEKSEEADATTPTSGGLRRSRAVRSMSSPIKPNAKKGFKERLKDAFRGESSMDYTSGTDDARYDDDYDYYDDEQDHRERRHSSGARSPPPSSHPSSQDDDSSISPEQTKPTLDSTYPKRRPPTNGFHELSTIMSMESMSNTESELSTVLSDTTITQTTGLTGTTDSGLTGTTGSGLTGTTGSGLSRHRSNKPGLKRRLTKHSDLVSVLSLPDNSSKVSRSKSIRATRSLRRTSSHLESATVEGLLQEFINDEDLYQRELKTLVDGVIPVLLSQYATNSGSIPDDIFSSSKARNKENSVARSVVQMGIALEKLRNAHRRCPMTDVHQLPQWLETVVSIYDGYLDVWRLGFNDLVVNLAPLSLDDEDSLIGALPRNEQGDVVNEDGERVDVAHLLKRPLVRVKWITRFIKVCGSCAQSNIPDTNMIDAGLPHRHGHRSVSGSGAQVGEAPGECTAKVQGGVR